MPRTTYALGTQIKPAEDHLEPVKAILVEILFCRTMSNIKDQNFMTS
jgi:hypothetical protein